MPKDIQDRGAKPAEGKAVDQRTETAQSVSAFVRALRAQPAVKPAGSRGRLIFALDATASRQPTWDQACQIQGQMFLETQALGGLEVQLVYYRGFAECKAAPWVSDSQKLIHYMNAVSCMGGQTQIAKVLSHGLSQAGARKVNALVFIGDAMEEDADRLCHLAGQLGLKNLPVFVFHEGEDPAARRTFEQIAKLSGGACCRFDAKSPQLLRDLLSAVAVYAAGGRGALLEFSGARGGEVLALTKQLPK